VLLAAGAVGAAALAGAGLGPLSVALLPFVASAVLALLGQATAWLWLLIVLSGMGLSWADAGVSVGGWSINAAGLQWGLSGVLGGLLLVLFHGTGVRWPPLFRWYALFVLVAVAGVLRTPDLFEGVKHTVQYATPLIVGLVALRVARAPEHVRILRGAFWGALALALVLALASLAWSEFKGDQPGLAGALGPRVFSTFLVPLLALTLAAWRVRRSPLHLALASVIFVLIVLTLSRMVTAAALGLIVVALAWDGSWLARIRAVAVAILLGFAVISFGPLRARMFDRPSAPVRVSEAAVSGEGRQASFSAGGISLSGRGLLWLQTWRHALESPITGHGTGSSTAFLENDIKFLASHPHNDYLRVFHDSGIIGLAVMLLTGAVGLLSLRSLYRRSRSVAARELALAAVLAWLGYLVVAVTDNVIVYVSFFTQNVFVLIALAHAAHAHDPVGLERA
jgi:O-antigen ligase